MIELKAAMFKKIKHLYVDETGASLPLALFLFMICALLASVVLAAGTTAIGQYADQAVSNQRYYAVSSTAKMFSDTLDNQTVTFSIEKSYDVVTTVTYSDGEVASQSQNESNVEYTAKIDGKDISGEQYTLLEQAALDLLGVTSASDPEAFWDDDLDFVDEPGTTKLNVEHSLSSVPDGYRKSDIEKALKVEAMERLNSDGTMTITFENASETNSIYAATLSLNCDMQILTEADETQPQISQTDTQRTETKHVTEKKNFIFTWYSLGISKAGE